MDAFASAWVGTKEQDLTQRNKHAPVNLKTITDGRKNMKTEHRFWLCCTTFRTPPQEVYESSQPREQ